MGKNIMQRLVGDGLAFLHAGGTIIKKELGVGEVLKLDIGCLVAMAEEVIYDVEFSGNLKSAIFGGEGLFLATMKGPGQVWMQSLPFSRLANRMHAASRKGGGDNKGEGGLFGGIGVSKNWHSTRLSLCIFRKYGYIFHTTFERRFPTDNNE